MSEHDDQVALFHWADLMLLTYPELEYMYANVNGAKLGYFRKNGKVISPQGIYTKMEGRKKGIPDITLPSARGGFFGLFVEMKHGKNKPTPEQVRVMEYLTSAGYKCAVCYGFDQARDVILDYLKRERTGTK